MIALADTTKRPVNEDALVMVAEMAVRRVTMTIQPFLRSGGTLDKAGLTKLQLIARLHERFSKGEFEATRMELHLLCDAAQWLLQLHARNNGMSVRHAIFVPERMHKVRHSPPTYAYAHILNQVSSGQLG